MRRKDCNVDFENMSTHSIINVDTNNTDMTNPVVKNMHKHTQSSMSI